MKYTLFITAIAAVVAIFAILFFLLQSAYPVFEQEGIWNFLTGSNWKPEGEIYGFNPQYGALPLLAASIMVTIGAMAISVPLGIGTAIFISEIATERIRNIIKPVVELLAGIPSVVYGFFGLIILVSWLQVNLDVASGEGWLAASILLAIMALPTIASVAEDAIKAVPREFKEGSLALGATKWETIKKVTVPSALSGITAAIILGIGRAIGETMAVMMVIGNSALIPSLKEPFMPLKTLTSAIAVEMGEAPYGSMWQHGLYGVAVLLLIIVFIINMSSTIVLGKIREKHLASGPRKKTRIPPVVIQQMKKLGKGVAVVTLLGLLLYLFGIPATVLILVLIGGIWLGKKILVGRTTNHYKVAKITEHVALGCITSTVIITAILLGIILYFIVVNGAEAISWEFLTSPPRNLGREGGIFPAIMGTLMLVGGAIAFALPLGLGAAIYLTEYTKEGKITKIIRTGAELLNGTPSIVFGLFGVTFFVLYLGWGISLLAGQITLGLMVLPTVIRTTEEALKSVPYGLREGSLALGATKWQTVKKVVLPPSIPGVMTGAILSIGRAAGETAPILFTAAVFSQRFLPNSVFDPVMALPYHLFVLTTNVPGVEAETNAYGTALVLLLLVASLYLAAIAIRNRYRRSMKW
ncbi:MAG: phosphate ABC transporter permease PstA [Candidatus Thermoplasmatota archaeon]|nr:phosphate ABC transporter permease PstA [Candidatus Thermoplasmatota archaeon]